MTRPRATTIYVKKRAVKVERKVIEPRAQRPASQFPSSFEAPELYSPPDRPILAEVERCLSHRPIAFPQKLWGEIL